MPEASILSSALNARTADPARAARPTARRTPETAPRRTVSVDALRQELAERLGAHKYDMWFDNASFAFDDTTLTVIVDTQFSATWVEQHFAGDLGEVAQDQLGSEVTISVEVRAPEPSADLPDGPSTPAQNASPAVRTKERTREKGRPRARLPRLRQLDEFVVGPSNRLAHGAAVRLLDSPDASGTPLFIHGECGVGKTHLLQGICRRFAERSGRWSHVRYVTGEQFTNEYIASVRANNIDEFRRRVRRLDLLAIDDVHFLSNKVATQSEFLHTLDAIDLTGERVVLASDEHPRLIKRFSQALISRFLSGMVVRIERPDRATRLSLVRRLAVQRALPVTEPAVEAIASRCVGSVRELEGTLTKLAALRGLADEPSTDPVGLLLVERLFAGHGWQPPTPVRLTTIIDCVCARLGVGRPDLMGPSRHRKVVLGRGLVSYLGREMTTHSYPEIARALGRSYHSTIHTAEQRVRGQIEAGATVDLTDGTPRGSLRELADQLRHEIAQSTTKGVQG